MSDVFFYDFDFGIKGIFPKHISLNITKKYAGYGTFEVHFSRKETALIDILSSEEYLLIDCEHGQAVVTGWRIDEDIAVFGKTPEWLMTKRVVSEFEKLSENSEKIAYSAVTDGMGDFVEIGDERGIGETRDYEISAPRTVYDAVCEALEGDGLGFRLYADFDEKVFRFEIYKGEETDVIFSETLKNAYQMNYTKEMEKWATGGVWFEKTETDGTRNWVKTDDGEMSGARRWNAILKGIKTDCEAESEAKKLTPSEQIECKTRRLEFGKDYNLGDVVRLQFECEGLRKALKRRVCAVEMYSDGGELGFTPILEDE